MEFLGYHRPDGSVGVRNHLLVLSTTGLTGPTARRIGRALPGARVVTMPYGGGLMGEDKALHRRALAGLAMNPNVGAVLMIGADPPKLDELAARIAVARKPLVAISLDECGHDALTLTDRGVRAGAKLGRDMSRQRRRPASLSHLFVGVECGRSDPSSGMASNPLVGRLVDAVVAAGGSAVFGETLEWLGAEHLLTRRTPDRAVGERIVAAVERRVQAATASGLDLLGDNPGPTNIAAGLSTIEEKSLGNVAKSGSGPIRGLLEIAQRPAVPGLYAMDAPAYSPESVTGFVAAGAQLILFTTGPGNSFVSALAPTIKLSANPDATGSLAEQLDFDASGVFEGRESAEAAARRLLELCIDVASGTRTLGEILDEGEEVVSRLGEAL